MLGVVAETDDDDDKQPNKDVGKPTIDESEAANIAAFVADDITDDASEDDAATNEPDVSVDEVSK